MARLYGIVVLLFVGGATIASIVGGTCWPTVIAFAALYFLLKVFSACDAAPPPNPTKPVYYNGRTDRRMPS